MLGLYWRRGTALATTVAVTFGIVANLAVTILTSEGVITLPAYFQAGGAVICVGVLLYVALSVGLPSAASSGQFAELDLSGRAGNQTRVDALVAACFVIVAAATVGMVLDWWQPVYYAVPLLATALMLLGALNRVDAWRGSVVAQVVAFGGITTVLFALAHATADGSGSFGGLPVTTGIFFYLLWPVTVLVPSLIYVGLYRSWLRHDLTEPVPGVAQLAGADQESTRT